LSDDDVEAELERKALEAEELGLTPFELEQKMKDQARERKKKMMEILEVGLRALDGLNCGTSHD
jgi:hypothetical protein